MISTVHYKLIRKRNVMKGKAFLKLYSPVFPILINVSAQKRRFLGALVQFGSRLFILEHCGNIDCRAGFSGHGCRGIITSAYSEVSKSYAEIYPDVGHQNDERYSNHQECFQVGSLNIYISSRFTCLCRSRILCSLQSVFDRCRNCIGSFFNQCA